jgi:AhpD family alkylhydroperoxidase
MMTTTTTAPEQRMTNVVMLVPEAFKALQGLAESTKGLGLPETTALLAILRASQINGCSVCVEMHSRELREAGESDERIWAVGAWRDSPHFSDAERAALALAEAGTRLSDAADPVPDAVWDEAARHYDERALAALILQIGSINIWNRLNVIVRQPAGQKW